MKKRMRRRFFLKNEQAISEEFTVLPALSVVMIGFALFVVLLAQTYIAYTDHINRLQSYQTANGLFQKLTNPDCYFIRPGGLIDLQILLHDNGSLQNLCQQCQTGGIFFLLRLCWGDQTYDFPTWVQTNHLSRIAVSKPVGIYLNDAQTIPGTLTIFVWEGAE